MIFLWRESCDAHKENVFVRKPLSGAPYFARSLRGCVQIRRNAVPNHATIADSVQPFQACRDFSRYGYRDNPSPVSKALQPAGPRLDFAFCDVVYRMHHQAWLEIHQRWECVSHHVDVGVYDVRPEFLEHSMQAIVGAAIESRSFAQKPGLQAGLIELLFQI